MYKRSERTLATKQEAVRAAAEAATQVITSRDRVKEDIGKMKKTADVERADFEATWRKLSDVRVTSPAAVAALWVVGIMLYLYASC